MKLLVLDAGAYDLDSPGGSLEGKGLRLLLKRVGRLIVLEGNLFVILGTLCLRLGTRTSDLKIQCPMLFLRSDPEADVMLMRQYQYNF